MSYIYVIDIETTGENENTEIIEFGGHVLIDPQTDILDSAEAPAWETYSQLCRPQNPITPETSAVHHITDWHVKDAPAVIPAFQDMTQGMAERVIFAAHSANFEREYIQPLNAGQRQIDWICTYKLALTLFPAAPSFKNAALFYYLGLFDRAPDYWAKFFQENQLHRAGPDARITREILKIFLNYVSVSEAIDISAKPALLQRVPFGRNRGTLWSDMDMGFLDWVLDRDFGEDILHTARHHQTRLLMEADDE